MLDDILTILICVFFPLILVIASAFIGDRFRKKLAHRIMVAVKEGRFKEFSVQQGARKLRILLLLAFISTIGIFTTIIFLWFQIWSNDMQWIIALFVFFSLSDIITGAFLFKHILDRLEG